VQAGFAGGEYVDALVQVPVGGAAGDRVVGGELGQAGAVEEPAQDEYRLREAAQRPGALVGAQIAASEMQQAGQVLVDDNFYRGLACLSWNSTVSGVSHVDSHRPSRQSCWEWLNVLPQRHKGRTLSLNLIHLVIDRDEEDQWKVPMLNGLPVTGCWAVGPTAAAATVRGCSRPQTEAFSFKGQSGSNRRSVNSLRMKPWSRSLAR
jgi:hypothetical protein